MAFDLVQDQMILGTSDCLLIQQAETGVHEERVLGTVPLMNEMYQIKPKRLQMPCGFHCCHWRLDEVWMKFNKNLGKSIGKSKRAIVNFMPNLGKSRQLKKSNLEIQG